MWFITLLRIPVKKAMEQLEGYEWLPRAPMTRSRACFASCVVGERIYVAGGLVKPYDDSTCTKEVEYYSTSEDEWTSVTAMPDCRRSFRLVLVNDRMYAVGGDRARSVIWIDSLFPNNAWSIQMANLPTELMSYDVFALGGQIYVVGETFPRVPGAIFRKLQLEDYVWEDVVPPPVTPWASHVVRVGLIKNRPCENDRRVRSPS